MSTKIISVLAIASIMFATSCSSDDVTAPAEETIITFATQIPETFSSRAEASYTFGDGTTATKLQYAVYLVNKDNSWTNISTLNGTSTIINKEANVQIRLAKGTQYKVVFWASAQNNPYTFNIANKVVSVDYSDCKTNDENLDAFYAVEDVDLRTATPENQLVVMTRPFAQLNIGASDIDQYQTISGQTISTAAITIPAYTQFSFETENVVGSMQTIAFNGGTLPTDQTFPISGSKYLTMSYLFADKNGNNVDITLDYGNTTNTLTFNSIPLKPNYRTNITGSLLTSEGSFDIQLSAGFNAD